MSEPATRVRRRTVATNILVGITALALLLMAAVEAYLVMQLNPVTRVLILLLLELAGWIPLALAVVAVCLRPHPVTFVALGVVGAALVAMLVIAWTVPDASYPYPAPSWPRRGSW